MDFLLDVTFTRTFLGLSLLLGIFPSDLLDFSDNYKFFSDLLDGSTYVPKMHGTNMFQN